MKNNFSFGSIEELDLKEILNSLEKKLCQLWNALTRQFSLSLERWCK